MAVSTSRAQDLINHIFSNNDIIKTTRAGSKEISNGFYAWAFRNFVVFVGGLCICVILLSNIKAETPIEEIIIFGFFSFLCLYYALINLPWLTLKLRLRVVLINIELDVRGLKPEDPPSDNLVEDLSELRHLLMRYTKPTRRLTIQDHEQVQVQRRVELLHSLINEVIYNSSFNGIKPLPGAKGESEKQFSYGTIGAWAGDLAEHLVARRRYFQTSDYEYSTLKYFLDKRIRVFKEQYPLIYKQELCSVESFYDHVGRIRADRHNMYIGMLSAVVITLITITITKMVEITFG